MMRLAVSAALIASSAVSSGALAFTIGEPSPKNCGVVDRKIFERTRRFATVQSVTVPETENVDAGEDVAHEENDAVTKRSQPMDALASAEVKARLDAQLAKLKLKDSTSMKLSAEDLNVVFEDDHIVVINKPSGVLTVSPNNQFPNLAQAVSDAFDCEVGTDRMVVHRLGMDTSGLIVFAKTMDAVRGMNAVFRNRGIQRKYEALVCGHVEKDVGLINLPLMRDYEFPPYVRVSTDEHQAVLADLDPEIVGKKLLEQPKESLTRYKVISREELDGQAVTRVSLTSISGRYHQLNVHLAAFGHPIVGDSTYGINGVAARNGGLSDAELESRVNNPNRASNELQQALDGATNNPCVHAKSLNFRHPVTQEVVSLNADAPF